MMPLEQCRPLNSGMVECGGFFVVASKLALPRSTALRALERRLRRLAEDESGLFSRPRGSHCTASSHPKTRPSLRLSYLFHSYRALGVVELQIKSREQKSSASRRDRSEIGCLQAKLARCSFSRSAAWTCLRIQHVAHGREIARADLLLNACPTAPGTPAAEARNH